jgi:hypothetical protein
MCSQGAACKNVNFVFETAISRFKRGGILFLLISALFFNFNGASLYAVSDLSIQRVEIFPTEAHVDDWMLVRVYVQNGSEDVSNVSLDLFKNASGDLNGRNGDMSYQIKRLAAGGLLPVDFVFKVKSSLNLRVMIDAPNALHEQNRTNNLSDLYPIPVDATALVDDTYEINNTRQTAPLISGGVYSLVSKDDDYFKIEAIPGDTVIVKIHNYEYQVSNLGLFLYDQSGNMVSASDGVGNVKNLSYRVGGSGNIKQTFYIYVKPGLNATGYILDVFTGKAPDIAVSSSVSVKKVIEKTGIKKSVVLLDTVFTLTQLKYHYKIEYTVNIRNNGEALKPGDFFYVDLFRNRTLKPDFGDYGNMGAIIVTASDFDATGLAQKSALLPVMDELPVVDGKITVGHYTYFAMADSDGYLLETNRDNNISGPVIVRADSTAGVFTDDSFEFSVEMDNPLPACLAPHINCGYPVYTTYPELKALSNPNQNQNQGIEWKSLLDQIDARIASETTLADDSLEKAGAIENDYIPWASQVTNSAFYISAIHKEAGHYDHLVAWDDDYYSVSVNPGETLECILQFRTIDGDLDLELYDTITHNLLAQSKTQFNREVVNYTNATAGARDYLIHVIPVGVNPDYTMIINKFSSVPDRDLEITYFKVSASTTNSANNPTLDVNLRYKNRGSVALGGSQLDVYQSANPITSINGMLPIRSIGIMDVLGGEEKIVEMFNVPAGNNYFYAVIDAPNNIIEKNELNNTAQTTASGTWAITDDNLERNSAGNNNNQYTNATRVPFGSYENLKALDDDWYVRSLASGKKLGLSLLYEVVKGDLDLSISRVISTPNGDVLELLSSQPGDGTDDRYLEYVNTTAALQDIYIKVHPKISANVYTLNLEEKPSFGQTDLAVTSVVTSPQSGLEGDLYRTTVCVTNVGDASITSAEKITVDLVVTGLSGTAAMGQYSRYFAVFTDGLAAGSSLYATFEYHLTRGQYAISAIADSDNLILELSKTNNIFTGQKLVVSPQSLPDAAIEITNVQQSGKTINATVTVSNSGDVQISSLNYRAYLREALGNGQSGRVAKTWDTTDASVLNANDTLNITFTFTVDDYTPSGNYYFSLEADPDFLLLERSRSNNYRQFTLSQITVTAFAQTYYIDTFRTLKYGSSGVDTVMELYKDGVLIRRNDDSGSKYSSIVAALAPGEYYVKIYAFGGAMGTYNFYGGASARTGIEEISLKDPSLYERNDAPGSANEYNMSAPLIMKQSIDNLADVDWIHFTIR